MNTQNVSEDVFPEFHESLKKDGRFILRCVEIVRPTSDGMRKFYQLIWV